MKKVFLSSLFAALFLLSRVAYAEVDLSDPQALIKTATQQILDEVRDRAIQPNDISRIMDIVNRDILPYTNFRRTASLAMGRYWRTATGAQQQEVVKQFGLLLVYRYSGAVEQLRADQRINYPPFHFMPMRM